MAIDYQLYYSSIYDIFPNHKKLVNNFNIELEKVYKFAKSNMISFRDVPVYINELSKHYKYASKALKSEIYDLPDFVIHIAESINKKNNLIKLSQEENPKEELSEKMDEAKQAGEDSWTRSWWAAGLSFIPGVGAVISLINLYTYSGAACMNSEILSWPCCEAALNVLVILLDIATIIGVAAGGAGAIPGLAGATLVKSVSPFLKLILGTAKLSSKTLGLLGKFGMGIVRMFEWGIKAVGGLKVHGTLGKLIAAKAPKLIEFLDRIAAFFKNMIIYLLKKMKRSDKILGKIKPTSKIMNLSNKIRFSSPVIWIRNLNLTSLLITDIFQWWMSDGEEIVNGFDYESESSSADNTPNDVSVLVERLCSSLRQKLESKNFKPEEIENAINQFRITLTAKLNSAEGKGSSETQSSADFMPGYGKRTFKDIDAVAPSSKLVLGD